MKKSFLVFVIMIVSIISFAQSHSENDSISIYLSRIKLIRDSLPPKAIELASHAIELAKASGNVAAEIQLLVIIGDIHFDSGDFQQAAERYLLSLQLAEKANLAHETAISECNLGKVYVMIENFELAQKYADLALEKSSSIHDTLCLAKVHNVLGNIANKQKHDDDALPHYEQSLTMYRKLGNFEGEAAELNNIANVYLDKKQFFAAINYYRQALEIDSVSHGDNAAFYYNNIGSAYSGMGNYVQALNYELTAVDLARKKTQNFSTLLNTYYQLTTTYSKLGDYKSAWEYGQQYIHLLDTSINENSLKRIAEIEAVYQNDKKQSQINLLRKDDEIKATVIRQQALLRNALIAGFVLLLLITYFLYRNNREKQRLNELLEKKNDQIQIQKNEITTYSAELEKLNHFKDKLFSAISHDLRNPLGNLQQVLAMTEDGMIEKGELEFYLKTLSNDVKNASSFLDNLLLWTKSQMKGIKPNLAVLDLKCLSEDVVKQLKPAADEKKVALENNVTVPVMILADMEMVKLVIRNLVSNAIKFCRTNDRIIINDSSNKNFVEVSIQDTGVGIPQAKLKTLFTSDVESSLGTGGESGTGLGLLLCKDFLVLHGGTIRVESTVGEGSKFYFTVPQAS